SSRRGCRRRIRRLAPPGSSPVIPRRSGRSPSRALSWVCSFPLSFCSGEVRSRVAAQVRLQEILGFGQREAVLAAALDLKSQIRAAALEQVPAVLVIGGEEVQVIAGHVERLRVFGSPEADEGPGDVV